MKDYNSNRQRIKDLYSNKNIVDLYKNGKTTREIGAIYHIDKKTVSKILKFNNVILENKGNKDNKGYTLKKSLPIKKINELYEKGCTIAELATKFDTYEKAISECLDNIKSPAEKLSKVLKHKDTIIELYDKGLSTYDISDELKINPNSIRKLLVKHEKIRSYKDSAKVASKKIGNKLHKSSFHQKVASIIKELGFEYEDEFNLDGWNFDIKVDKLLIECQGSYWHKLSKERVNRDKKKKEVAQKHGYDHLMVWDTQTGSHLKNLLEYKLCGNYVEFKFDDIKIVEDFQRSKDLMRHHYSNKIRNGKHYFIAVLNNVDVAACVFSRAIRQGVASKQGLKNSDVLELSRFVIHPKYHKRNFASWFISRCIKNIDCKMVVAFSDLTYNHGGGIYKALGFVNDGHVEPDYWYVKSRNVVHKKTVWNKAKKLGLSEDDFAVSNGYKKIFGFEKIRWIKHLN